MYVDPFDSATAAFTLSPHLHLATICALTGRDDDDGNDIGHLPDPLRYATNALAGRDDDAGNGIGHPLRCVTDAVAGRDDDAGNGMAHPPDPLRCVTDALAGRDDDADIVVINVVDPQDPARYTCAALTGRDDGISPGLYCCSVALLASKDSQEFQDSASDSVFAGIGKAQSARPRSFFFCFFSHDGIQ